MRITRQNLSLALKTATVLFSFVGVILACVFASVDGYHPWGTRLLYFTQLSNLWIGGICLCLLICELSQRRSGGLRVMPWMYTLKFILTVSIALTGIIFCGFLAPFSDDSYNAWSFYSVFNHAVVPVLALADFYLDPYPAVFRRRDVLYSAMPPFVYFIFCLVMNLVDVDFGKGDPYPYFFLNFKSEAGFFGFAEGEPYPIIGSFYWLLVCFAVIMSVACLLYRLHPATRRAARGKGSSAQVSSR